MEKSLRISNDLVPAVRAFMRFWQQPDGPVETHLRSLMESVLIPSAKSGKIRQDDIAGIPDGRFISQRDYRLLRKLELRSHSAFQEIRNKLDQGWAEEPGPLTLAPGDKPWLRQPRLVSRANRSSEANTFRLAPAQPQSRFSDEPFPYLVLMQKLLSDADLQEFQRGTADLGPLRKARRALYWEYLRQLELDLRAAQKVRESAALRSDDTELQAMLQENILCFYHLNRLRTAGLLHWMNLPKLDLAGMVQHSLAALEIRLVPAALPVEA